MHSPHSGSSSSVGSLAQVRSSAHFELSKPNFNYRPVTSFMTENLYQKPGGAARNQPVAKFHNYPLLQLPKGRWHTGTLQEVYACTCVNTDTTSLNARAKYGPVGVVLALLRHSAVYQERRVRPYHMQGHKCSPIKRLKCAGFALARIHALQP